MDKWLRNNNVVKIIALLIAIFLWIVVHMDVQSSSTAPSSGMEEKTIYNVSVTPKYDTAQYSISMDPEEVNVILKGKSSALKRINPGTFQVEADLTGYGVGNHSVLVKAVGNPDSVTVEIVPETVKVSIEQKDAKEVPVSIYLMGKPAAGFKAGQPIIKPNRVHVTAPTSVLDQIETARGEVNIDGASSAVAKQVKLTAYDKNGKIVDGAINPPVIDVEVPVTSPFKTMPLQLKITGQPAKGYAVAAMVQTPEQVTVYGSQNVLDKMDFYDSGLQVDLTGLQSSKTFQFDIPLMSKVSQVDPAKVEMEFDIVPSVTRTFTDIPFTLAGKSDSYDTKVVTPATGTTSVTVEGAPEVLDKLKPQDIQAIVNVSNLPAGQHEIPVSFNLPPFVKKADPQDIKAVVEISQKSAGAGSPGATAQTAPSTAGSTVSRPSALPVSPTPSGTAAPTTQTTP